MHFVEVSDDDSSMSYGEFNQEVGGLSNPGIPADYTFHAICSDEQIIFTPPPPLPPPLQLLGKAIPCEFLERQLIAEANRPSGQTCGARGLWTPIGEVPPLLRKPFVCRGKPLAPFVPFCGTPWNIFAQELVPPQVLHRGDNGGKKWWLKVLL